MKQTSNNQESAIIPRPAVHSTDGTLFPLPRRWELECADESLRPDAERLLEKLRASCSGPSGSYILKIGFPDTGDSFGQKGAEAYTLHVTGNRAPEIRIIAGGQAGVMYAGETLLTMIRSHEALPACGIEDWPRFSWRGSMLDVARHFFPVEYVITHLERMAEAKLNVFHWHLTDDQGWRFEVPEMPKLIDTGAWRSKSEPEGHDPRLGIPAANPYGGFYTDEDIRIVLKKAQELHILVIPELDIPGHNGAALAAYPHLGCDAHDSPKLHEPATKWSILDYFLCPAKETSFDFVRAAVKRLAELFPGPYIHIGGDEVKRIEVWEQCPTCSAFMKQHGYKNGRDLEAYFMNRACAIVRECGKIPMAWDDVVHAFAGRKAEDPPTILQFWANLDNLHHAVNDGYPIILSPSSHAYLDMTYAPPEIKQWAGYLSLEKVYSLDPSVWDLSDVAVKGIEAPIWTEFTQTTADVDRLLWPRLLAVAEAAWTIGPRRDWESFRERLASRAPLLKKAGIGFHPCPEIDWPAF